jgi:hypothetical protein
MGAAREHGIIDALATAGVHTVADTAYQGAGSHVRVPQRRRLIDPDTGRYRRLSRSQQEPTPRTPLSGARASGPTPN